MCRRASVILVAAVLLALPACSGPSDAALTARPPAPEGRRWAAVSWDTVFTAGGAPQDTLLLLPTRLAADETGVSVLDRLAGRVLRYDRSGRLLWTFGRRGGGPGEFAHARDIKLDRRGSTWVLDVENARLTVVDSLGRLAKEMPLSRIGGGADAFVPEPGGGAVLLTMDAELPLVYVSQSGEVAERSPYPWFGYRSMHPLAAQLVTGHEPASGRWVAAFGLADGFFAFEALRWLGYRGRYVEPVPPARVAQRTRFGPGRRDRATWLARAGFAAETVSLEGERLFVLFAGRTPYRYRVLDIYSVADGAYLESYLLPARLRAAAFAGGLVYGLYEDPYPALAAWRPRTEVQP